MSKASIASAAVGALGMFGGSKGNSLLNSYNSRPYNTSITVNGKEISGQKVRNNKITTRYNQSEEEKALMDYTSKNLLSGLENINVFSDDVQKGIQNQVDAYTKQGLKTLNEAYTPMFRELKSDIASRFGNFDNSIFMDNLNEIEKNRTEALNNLTQDILAKQSELYEAEMNNRYTYLDRLSSINQNLYSNMLNFLQLAGSSS